METSIDGLMEQQHRMKRSVALPWVLFIAALVGGAATSLHLALQLKAVRSQAAVVAAKLARDDMLCQQVGELRAASTQLDLRLQKLERENSNLLALKDELELKVKTPVMPAANLARSSGAKHVHVKSSPEIDRRKRPARTVAKKQDRG